MPVPRQDGATSGRPLRSVLATTLLGVLTACGSASPTHPAATAGPTTSIPETSLPATAAPTTLRASAAVDLAPYFSTARGVDRRLSTAAALVNGNVGADAIAADPATARAVIAADPHVAARAIPAGLEARLLAAVLLVQSDLVSRFYALQGFVTRVSGASQTAVPLSDPSAEMAISCLGNGADAAAAFGADLAAAVTAAEAAGPVTVAPAFSRPAAELALLLERMIGRNAGCGSCGGQQETSLPSITWYPSRRQAAPQAGKALADGNIDGVEFLADYSSASGWAVTLYAC